MLHQGRQLLGLLRSDLAEEGVIRVALLLHVPAAGAHQRRMPRNVSYTHLLHTLQALDKEMSRPGPVRTSARARYKQAPNLHHCAPSQMQHEYTQSEQRQLFRRHATKGEGTAHRVRAVESAPVIGVERRVQRKALGQVRVGEEQAPVRDEVCAAVADGLDAALARVAAG